MGSELIVRNKQIVGGTITEVVVWRVSPSVPGCAHSFKYRFYFGLADGTCIVRYDNERGKGDHRHIGDREEPYQFVTLPQLFRDFNTDKAAWFDKGAV
ncbi:hypothetical protein OR1_03568 [Geobacter sp. OR-1]|uniref:toxin-antitoxin system TumE family protein n=1 Tax=Geobacter sp. OR-1 TaxID=1266765 RepID=UPI0005436479|nr:DUF6516 family protein [Geobacter sp. OR-1]GAM11257.1 hypothetical protein OR1_03568 [Geobacter sp. OR-1]